MLKYFTLLACLALLPSWPLQIICFQWKKFRPVRDLNLWPLRYRCRYAGLHQYRTGHGFKSLTGNITLWFDGSLVHWFDGSLVQWIFGLMDLWFDGSLDPWFAGSMVWWINGSVVCWFDGLMDQWIADSIDSWFDGSMVRWFDESLVWCWLFSGDLLKAIWIRWPQVLKTKLGFRTIFQNPFMSVRECLWSHLWSLFRITTADIGPIYTRDGSSVIQ